ADFALSEMTHAESSYLQVALETGLLGAAVLALALITVVGRLLWGYFRAASDGARMVTAAVVSAAAGALIHAVVDFIWYVPAIVVSSLVLLVVGLKSSSKNFNSETISVGIRFPRAGWALLTVLGMTALIRVQPELWSRIEAEQHWYDFLRTRVPLVYDTNDGYEDLAAGEVVSLEVQQVSYTTEADVKAQKKEQQRRTAEAELRYTRLCIPHLQASLKARPDQHRVQLALAEQLLRLFELLQENSDNPMPLNMIRDAAKA
ncbi:MAG: hypothetical protein KDA89_24390, partial [Planctomycetaceae bacterium]|nr:hypothetical protein [Planctomycetaceae bacterium]